MNPTVIRRSEDTGEAKELLLTMRAVRHNTEYRIVEKDVTGFEYVRFAWYNNPERPNLEYHTILGKESKWKEVEQKSPVETR